MRRRTPIKGSHGGLKHFPPYNTSPIMYILTLNAILPSPLFPFFHSLTQAACFEAHDNKVLRVLTCASHQGRVAQARIASAKQDMLRPFGSSFWIHFRLAISKDLSGAFVFSLLSYE